MRVQDSDFHSFEKIGVRLPPLQFSFSEESALDAIKELGYPMVVKMAVGSWGRLLSKINDREEDESILKYKAILGISYIYSLLVFPTENCIYKSSRYAFQSH